MDTAIQWSKYLKQENPLLHKLFISLYPISAALLLVLALFDGLPFASLSQVSAVSQVGLVLGIVGLTHLTSAGVLFCNNEGRTDKASTIATYGGIGLIALIVIAP